MDNIRYWIALQQVEGIGPALMSELFNKLQSIGLSIIDCVGLSREELQKEFSLPDKLTSALSLIEEVLPKIEKDYFECIDSGVEIVPFFSGKYPQRLHDLLGSQAPAILYVRGNTDILTWPGAAILGDREVSERGELIAFEGAKCLAAHSISTISGYASGAEMTAHRSALINGGSTTAFIPSGINHFKLRDTLKEILDPERFAVISPFYPTAPADKYNAFTRNKIICALAHAVFIVEAPAEGGMYEAAKSAQKLEVPLFTAEYTEYPKNAEGNKIILETMGGHPVQGRWENDLLVPNMDAVIGAVKFK